MLRNCLLACFLSFSCRPAAPVAATIPPKPTSVKVGINNEAEAIACWKRSHNAIERERLLGKTLVVECDFRDSFGWHLYIGEFVDASQSGFAHTCRVDTVLVKDDGSLWRNRDETQLDDDWTLPLR